MLRSRFASLSSSSFSSHRCSSLIIGRNSGHHHLHNSQSVVLLQQKRTIMSWIFGGGNDKNKSNKHVEGTPVTPDEPLSAEAIERAKKFEALNTPRDHPSINPSSKPPTANALCEAAASGNLEEVQDLMRRGAPANIAPNSAGLTPLHTACAGGHVHIVEYILSQALMSPIATASRENITPLHIAAVTDKTAVVEFLCKTIRETNVPKQKMADGRMIDPIDMRANEERVTALHLASKFASKETVEVLINYGANPTIFTREEEPQSPISVACVRGDLDLLKVLFLSAIKIPGLTEKDVVELSSPVSGTTPLQMACGAGHKSIVEFLINDCDANPRLTNELCPHPPIYLAAWSGHHEVVRFFLESKKCGPLKPDECQVEEGVSALHAACRAGSAECVSILLEKGADRYLTRKDTGIAPLHQACLHGHLDVVKLLQPVGYPLPKKLPFAEAKGYTATHLAVIGGNADVLEYLFDIGISSKEINSRADERRLLPLHLAGEAGNAKMVKILIEHIEDPAMLNLRDATGGTPLHAACYSGNMECVEMLVTAGADMGISDQTGSTPMLVAKNNNHQHLIEYMQRVAKATNSGNIPGQVGSKRR